MNILITDGIAPFVQETLIAQGHNVVNQFYKPEELGAALRDFDAVIIRSATKIRREQLEAAKGGKLKLIIRAGVGIDNIDVDAAKEMGVTVRNTPNAPTNAVAELAIAHMFSCARYISSAGCTMRQGRWEKKAYGHGFELYGKTLGIVGFGRIGRRVAQIAAGIGLKVLAYDPFPQSQTAGVTMVSLDELMEQSDIISLHSPAQSQPIITTERIAQMKEGVVIINTSRGCNIDEDALLEGLNSRKVRAAGLDVWAQEPIANFALYSHPAVSSTPHIGTSTDESQRRIGEEVVQIISDFPRQ